MTRRRPYPDEVAGPFPTPPGSFTDTAGREILIRAAGDWSSAGGEDELEAVVRMYAAFDPADRAQGIPPTREDAIRRWLAGVFTEEAVNLLAWHDNTVVGHATLVPDGEGAYELAIFVLQDYQRAGIGRVMLESVLGLGATLGVDRVWLTVERWNEPAIRLYRAVGFEPSKAQSFELEMSLRLPGDPQAAEAA